MNKKLLSFSVFILGCTIGFGQDLSNYKTFKGDTLDGFDQVSCYHKALSMRLHGKEVKSYIGQQQRSFVANKYHLPDPAKAKSLVLPNILTSACNNVDFENGTFGGWVGGVGWNVNSSQPLFISSVGITSGINLPETACNYHTLVNTAMTPDPYSLLPAVDPGGGTWACRLGGENVNVESNGGFGACTSGNVANNANSGGETLQQTFIVTAANAQFTYKYSVIMEMVNHANNQQPYFRVEVLDSNGHITSPCQQYYVEADTTGNRPQGFLTSALQDGLGDSVAYCPWTANALNLSNYIGHPVTVRFTATGCTFSAHFCYAYIDCSCGPVQTVPTHPNICQGQRDTLIAPGSGGIGTYLWTTLPSGTAGIVGPNNKDTVFINASGTYEVNVTYPNGCHYKIDTTITFNPLPVATAIPTNVTCHGLHNGSATVNVTTGVGPYSYSWSPSPGGGQGTSTGTGLAAGTNYTVLITGAAGCSSTTTVQVTEPPALTATNTHVNVLCNGGNNGSGTVNASGGTVSYTFSWTPSGGTASTASGLTAGIYTCNIIDRNGCTISSLDTISQPAALSVTNIATPVACHGATTGADTMLVSGGTPAYTYTWTPISASTPKATGLPAGTYTCTIADAHNCLTTAIAHITEPPLLVLTPHSQPTPCGGVSGSASVTVVGGTGAYTYSWAPPSVSAIDSITALSAGIYTVTVTDHNGCIQSSAIPVSNTGGPKDTVLHSTNVKCFGGTNGAATIAGHGGTGALSFTWSPATGTHTPLVDTTLGTNLAAGVYLITVSDAFNCRSTTSDTIIQPTAVTATAALTHVNCFGQNNGQAALTTSGGHPGYTYIWSPIGGNTSIGTNLTAGVFTCSIADTNSCPGSIVVTITQPAILAFTDTINPTTCFGSNNGSVLINPTGGTLGYTYSWSGGGGFAPNATGLVAGTYTCTITDSHGCNTSAVTTVTQPTMVNPTNTTIGAHCFGQNNGTATAIGAGGNAGGYTYFWTPTGGNTATTIGLPAGTYTCTVTDPKGCSGTTIAHINQPSVLVANNTPKEISCSGLADGNIICNPSGGTPTYTFAWTPSGGSADTAKNLGPNTYTCTLTDGHGCTTTTIAVLTQPTQLRDSINALSLNCFGVNNGTDTVRVKGGTSPYSYSWNPGGGTNAYQSGLSALTYTCTVTDAHGCIQAATVTVAQPSALLGNPSSTDAICTAAVGSATVIPTGGTGPYSYSWTTPFGFSNTVNNLYQGTYTCTVIDSRGCTKVVTVPVGHHNNIVHANFTATPSNGVAPLSVHFLDHSYPNIATYWFNFGDGGGALVDSITDVYGNPGTYTVTEQVTDANGCQADTSIVIHVKEHPSHITVPNIFTPNGDGENDFFKISWYGIDAYSLKIYDRWGVLMCQFSHPWLEWDGLTFSGAKANDGTYYYVIEATGDDGVSYNLNGFLQLIRK